MHSQISALPKVSNIRCLIILGFLVSIVLVPKNSLSQTWLQESLSSFTKGTLDASGQNLYINSKGQIRTIYRFGLNSDGNIDLLFNSTVLMIMIMMFRQL